jgi:hypothetical protein
MTILSPEGGFRQPCLLEGSEPAIVKRIQVPIPLGEPNCREV